MTMTRAHDGGRQDQCQPAARQMLRSTASQPRRHRYREQQKRADPARQPQWPPRCRHGRSAETADSDVTVATVKSGQRRVHRRARVVMGKRDRAENFFQHVAGQDRRKSPSARRQPPLYRPARMRRAGTGRRRSASTEWRMRLPRATRDRSAISKRTRLRARRWRRVRRRVRLPQSAARSTEAMATETTPSGKFVEPIGVVEPRHAGLATTTRPSRRPSTSSCGMPPAMTPGHCAGIKPADVWRNRNETRRGKLWLPQHRAADQQQLAKSRQHDRKRQNVAGQSSTRCRATTPAALPPPARR